MQRAQNSFFLGGVKVAQGIFFRSVTVITGRKLKVMKAKSVTETEHTLWEGGAELIRRKPSYRATVAPMNLGTQRVHV